MMRASSGVVCGAAASGNYHWANPFDVRHTHRQSDTGPRRHFHHKSIHPSALLADVPWDLLSCAVLWYGGVQNSPDAVPLSLGVEDFAKSLACMLLAGPLLTGYTQTINDWYDREIDAINEPYRPIPSGRISEGQVRRGRRGSSHTHHRRRAGWVWR